MTQEEKHILFIDLCARLPYGVVVELDEKFGFNKGTRPLVKELLDLYCVEGIKPYLRPMSSMTDDEANEYNIAIDIDIEPERIVDWFNAHHFDYRGLIPMGLALEAPEDMYNQNL